MTEMRIPGVNGILIVDPSYADVLGELSELAESMPETITGHLDLLLQMITSGSPIPREEAYGLLESLFVIKRDYLTLSRALRYSYEVPPQQGAND